MILLAISALVLGAARERPVVRVETNRYDLRIEGTPDEAARFGRILEAAWPTFREFFHAEPPLAPGNRLAIRVYDTRDACLAGAMGDGTAMPPKKEPAWFSTKTGTVYLYRQTSDWYTRYLVIYGACMQFHALAKPKHKDLDEWYTHGIAESFAVHAFDGARLELATSPPVSSADHAARALEKLGGRILGLDPFTEERLEDPSVRWALVRFATSASGGKHRARFEKLALGASGSKVSGYDFMRSLGREKEIAEEFTAWLLAAQAPLEIVTSDWEAMPDGRIVGRSAAAAQAMCLAKPRFRSLEADVETPTDPDAGTPGILFGFRDERNYAVAKLRPPVLFVEHILDGRQHGGDSIPIPTPGGSHHVKVTSDGARVVLEIDGRSLDPMEVPEGRIGLVSIGGASTFRSVICR
jgi:hypothetical protein